MSYEYPLIHTRLDRGVLKATIDNPPINLLTPQLFGQLNGLTEEAEADDQVRVVVLDSANPEFFIAHYDLEAILRFPTEGEAVRGTQLGGFHVMCERVRTMATPTLLKIAGRVGGGGSEFSASCDMRFGVLGRTIVNQMEVALGILPGGTGTQRLPRLLGRGRALEVILGSDDLDAETAERWGYLNRAFADEAAMHAFVDRLALRIAGFPREAVALAKASALDAEPPFEAGLIEEAFRFQQSVRTEGAQQNMRAALVAGAQTREGELRMGELCQELAEAGIGKPDDHDHENDSDKGTA